jgi:hypothetical protein
VSAHEELEGQLLQSVAARARSRRGPTARLGRWWASGVWRGWPIATVALWAVLAVAAAGLGTDVQRAHRSPAASAPSFSARAFVSPCGLCTTVSDQLHGMVSGEETVAAGHGSSSVAR